MPTDTTAQTANSQPKPKTSMPRNLAGIVKMRLAHRNFRTGSSLRLIDSLSISRVSPVVPRPVRPPADRRARPATESRRIGQHRVIDRDSEAANSALIAPRWCRDPTFSRRTSRAASRATATRRRPLSLVGRQIAIARTEGQAVGLAERGADANSDRQIEIGDQTPHDQRLLIIFAAEKCHVRLGKQEQLENHGCDSHKVARPTCPFDGWATLPTSTAPRGREDRSVRVAGTKTQSAPCWPNKASRLEGAGIAGKIFAGPNWVGLTKIVATVRPHSASKRRPDWRDRRAMRPWSAPNRSNGRRRGLGPRAAATDRPVEITRVTSGPLFAFRTSQPQRRRLRPKRLPIVGRKLQHGARSRDRQLILRSACLRRIGLRRTGRGDAFANRWSTARPRATGEQDNQLGWDNRLCQRGAGS